MAKPKSPPELLTALESVRFCIKPVVTQKQLNGYNVSFLGRHIYVRKTKTKATWRLKTKVNGINYERLFDSEEAVNKACETIMIRDLTDMFVAMPARAL